MWHSNPNVIEGLFLGQSPHGGPHALVDYLRRFGIHSGKRTLWALSVNSMPGNPIRDPDGISPARPTADFPLLFARFAILET
jgi:hypothetical protein